MEQSIGDTLKKARTRKKLVIAEVEEQTRIRARFLLALESDSWDQIPSEVYGRGYLETYALFLQLPVDRLMEQFERSRATYLRLCADPQVEIMPQTQINTRSFQLTPRIAIISLTVMAAFLFIGAIATQVSKYAAAPRLSLVAPAEAKSTGSSQLEVYSDSYTVNGQTAEGATVKVNGQPVAVNQDGSFTYTIPVQKGVNAVVVEATNTSGKTSQETLTVVVK